MEPRHLVPGLVLFLGEEDVQLAAAAPVFQQMFKSWPQRV